MANTSKTTAGRGMVSAATARATAASATTSDAATVEQPIEEPVAFAGGDQKCPIAAHNKNEENPVLVEATAVKAAKESAIDDGPSKKRATMRRGQLLPTRANKMSKTAPTGELKYGDILGVDGDEEKLLRGGILSPPKNPRADLIMASGEFSPGIAQGLYDEFDQGAVAVSASFSSNDAPPPPFADAVAPVPVGRQPGRWQHLAEIANQGDSVSAHQDAMYDNRARSSRNYGFLPEDRWEVGVDGTRRVGTDVGQFSATEIRIVDRTTGNVYGDNQKNQRTPAKACSIIKAGGGEPNLRDLFAQMTGGAEAVARGDELNLPGWAISEQGAQIYGTHPGTAEQHMGLVNIAAAAGVHLRDISHPSVSLAQALEWGLPPGLLVQLSKANDACCIFLGAVAMDQYGNWPKSLWKVWEHVAANDSANALVKPGLIKDDLEMIVSETGKLTKNTLRKQINIFGAAEDLGASKVGASFVYKNLGAKGFRQLMNGEKVKFDLPTCVALYRFLRHPAAIRDAIEPYIKTWKKKDVDLTKETIRIFSRITSVAPVDESSVEASLVPAIRASRARGAFAVDADSVVVGGDDARGDNDAPAADGNGGTFAGALAVDPVHVAAPAVPPPEGGWARDPNADVGKKLEVGLREFV